MRKYLVIALFALFATNPLFADESTGPEEARSPDCVAIAKACKDAGFGGREFWFDCMKPVLFNKPVKGVTVDANVVKACKEFKIKNLQEQIDELKSAQ